MGDVDMRERIERSTGYQEEWKIKEAVVLSDSGQLIIQEVSRTLMETWKDDVRRVCDEFDINIGDAEKLLKKASEGDADAKTKLKPLRLNRVKRWTNGGVSTLDEPGDVFSGPGILSVNLDHWSYRVRKWGAVIEDMEKRIKERLEEEDIEAGDADHQWERHEITKYREWAHSEGFRATGDKSPWRPDFYDQDRLDGLDDNGKAQLVQEAIWTALVMPPGNENANVNLHLIMNTFCTMFDNGCNGDQVFIDPETLNTISPFEYCANIASDANARQVAAHQMGKTGESGACGWEAGVMCTVMNAIFDRGGSHYTDLAIEVTRARTKRDNAKLKSRKRDPVNVCPRGCVPGYKDTLAPICLAGSAEDLVHTPAKYDLYEDGDRDYACRDFDDTLHWVDPSNVTKVDRSQCTIPGLGGLK